MKRGRPLLGPLERANLNHWTAENVDRLNFRCFVFFWFLEYRTMGRVRNPVILGVLHHRLSPLEPIREEGYSQFEDNESVSCC
jgi:hypothetical protein